MPPARQLKIPIPLTDDIDFGPQAVEFRAFVERLRRLTVGEVNVLRRSRRPRPFLPHGLFPDELGSRLKAFNVARHIVPLDLPDTARGPIRAAACATAVRDMMDPAAYRWVMRPWRDAMRASLRPLFDARPASDLLSEWADERDRPRIAAAPRAGEVQVAWVCKTRRQGAAHLAAQRSTGDDEQPWEEWVTVCGRLLQPDAYRRESLANRRPTRFGRSGRECVRCTSLMRNPATPWPPDPFGDRAGA